MRHECAKKYCNISFQYTFNVSTLRNSTKYSMQTKGKRLQGSITPQSACACPFPGLCCAVQLFFAKTADSPAQYRRHSIDIEMTARRCPCIRQRDAAVLLSPGAASPAPLPQTGQTVCFLQHPAADGQNLLTMCHSSMRGQRQTRATVRHRMCIRRLPCKSMPAASQPRTPASRQPRPHGVLVLLKRLSRSQLIRKAALQTTVQPQRLLPTPCTHRALT